MNRRVHINPGPHNQPLRQLRIVGNGVCPQQAATALRYLIAVATNFSNTQHQGEPQ